MHIGNVFKVIMPATGTCGSRYVYAIVLALATLGSVTRIGSFLFFVMPPKVAKASKEGNIALQYHGHYQAKLCLCKHDLMHFIAF
jgi:hypothetical protein